MKGQNVKITMTLETVKDLKEAYETFVEEGYDGDTKLNSDPLEFADDEIPNIEIWAYRDPR